MGKWQQKLASFMYGRYGIDALYYGLLVLLIAFNILYVTTGGWVFSFLGCAVVIFAAVRVFSRNFARRRRENEIFLRCWHPVRDFCKLQYHRIKDGKTAIYRRCPACKAILRLPRRKGTHTTNCPRCAHRFDVTVRF